MSEPSQPTPPGAPEPPVPPTPPVPPVPPAPPVPQYGEYAPGFVPPAPAPEYAAYAPAAGQAPHGQPYGAASYPQQQAGGRPGKTWDIVLTSILLVLGLIGASLGVIYGFVFSSPALLDQSFQQGGLGGFNGTVGAAPGVLIISHVLLYLLALGGAIPLMLTRRVAFWAPLTAGVIAAIIFWVTVFAVLLSDPTIMSGGGLN